MRKTIPSLDFEPSAEPAGAGRDPDDASSRERRRGPRHQSARQQARQPGREQPLPARAHDLEREEPDEEPQPRRSDRRTRGRAEHRRGAQGSSWGERTQGLLAYAPLAAAFLFGAAFGVLGLAVFQSYTGKGLPAWAAGSTGAVAAGSGLSSSNPTAAPLVPGAPAPTEGPVDVSGIPIRTATAKGAADAPVVILEYSDFQCPFCRKAAETTVPQLWTTYGESGEVRFVYKHYTILGQESVWAALASECAADQERFWDYHDELFRLAGLAGGKNVGAFTKERLNEYARALGLDMARFEPCLREEVTLARVNADNAEARDFAISGTPTFFVNGERIVGAQEWGIFAQAIDRALAAARP